MWTLWLYLLLLHVFCLSVTFGDIPRMIFTDKDISILRKRISAPPAAEILTEGDVVKVIGTSHISLVNFQNPQKLPVELSLHECVSDGAHTKACISNITVVHKSQDINHIFVCGTNEKETTCCYMNISEHSARCSPSDKLQSIQERIPDFNLKGGDVSAFVESPESADLYIADSGSQGIRRFGERCVQSASRNREQSYVKLIISKQDSINDIVQDKVYGFYNEKNTNSEDMFSDMWKPYVTQICLSDNGGPKIRLQFKWTSQLNARLFCGDVEQKQYFSKLLDLTTVEAEDWRDTRVYGLFQNEWGMRAVCVYSMQDIDHVFKTSPFRNSDRQLDRPRTCVADSTKLSFETLRQIESNYEMEKCIQPGRSPGPLLISSHHYTHITAHDFHEQRLSNNTVLFLSLQNGAVHKVGHVQSGSEAKVFIIAEYKAFNHRAHITSMSLSASTKKLFVASSSELAQVDVVHCGRYGNTCEECVLARDPNCGWSEGVCSENGRLQDPAQGNISICPDSKPTQLKVHSGPADKESAKVEPISVPVGSRHFSECPVSSRHAHYSWYHGDRPLSCQGGQHQCLLLLPNVSAEQGGSYVCESEERGHRRQVSRFTLTVEDDNNNKNSGEGLFSGLGLWFCLISAFLVHSRIVN